MKTDYHCRFGGLLEKVLERDKYTCQICGMTNAEHIKKWGKRITAHHKDKQGRYSEIKNHSMKNLITLCLSCHGKEDVVIKSKLTPEQVKEIRKSREEGVHCKTLSSKYNVSFQNIYLIVEGKTWKYV